MIFCIDKLRMCARFGRAEAGYVYSKNRTILQDAEYASCGPVRCESKRYWMKGPPARHKLRGPAIPR